TFFEKSVNAFPRVFCLHQFVEINLLGSSKTFVEVHAIPRVDSLFRCSEGGGTQLGHLLQDVFNHAVELVFRDRAIRQAYAGGFASAVSRVCAATSTPAENELLWLVITIVEISGRLSISETACANSSIICRSMTFSGGLCREIRATDRRTSVIIRDV